jgi:hypothetical protein
MATEPWLEVAALPIKDRPLMETLTMGLAVTLPVEAGEAGTADRVRGALASAAVAVVVPCWGFTRPLRDAVALGPLRRSLLLRPSLAEVLTE